MTLDRVGFIAWLGKALWWFCLVGLAYLICGELKAAQLERFADLTRFVPHMLVILLVIVLCCWHRITVWLVKATGLRSFIQEEIKRVQGETVWRPIEERLSAEIDPRTADQIAHHLQTIRAGKDRFRMRDAASALGVMGEDALPALHEMVETYLNMLSACLGSADFGGGGDRFTRARLIKAIGQISSRPGVAPATRERVIQLLEYARKRDPQHQAKKNAAEALEKALQGTSATNRQKED